MVSLITIYMVVCTVGKYRNWDEYWVEGECLLQCLKKDERTHKNRLEKE